MAASPATSNKTVTGTDGNLSAGTANASMPAEEKTSWENPFHWLLNTALCSLGIRALPVLSKCLHERFDELDSAFRAIVIHVWVTMATFLVLALAVPPLLLVYFIGPQMAQIWAMAATLCFCVFFLLFLCVRRNWQCYADFLRLSYGLLLVYFAARVIGPRRTAVLFLHVTTAWAAGNMGYHLAVHRLPKRIEDAIDALPSYSPSCHSKEAAEELTQSISTPIGGFVVAVLWTALVPAILFGQSMTKALDIVFVLSYVGWIHAALWLARAAGERHPMHVILKIFYKPMPSLPSLLVACVIASPFIGLLSAVPVVLFQWLLLMALVLLLGYSIAVYMHGHW